MSDEEQQLEYLAKINEENAALQAEIARIEASKTAGATKVIETVAPTKAPGSGICVLDFVRVRTPHKCWDQWPLEVRFGATSHPHTSHPPFQPVSSLGSRYVRKAVNGTFRYVATVYQRVRWYSK